MADGNGLPAYIRELAEKQGAKLPGDIAGQIGSFSVVPPELQTAYQNADYATIQSYMDKATQDLLPIYAAIHDNGDGAFTKTKPPPNDPDNYWYLAWAGDSQSPDALIWCTTFPLSSTDARVGDQTNRVAQVGTWSKNSNTWGISNQIWSSSEAALAAGGVATIVLKAVFKYVRNRLRGMLAQQAAQQAVGEAGEEVVAAGIVEEATWVTITSFVGGLVVGAVIGAIAYYLVMWIINFLVKAYKLCISIYNWDTEHAFNLVQEFGSNETPDGNMTLPYKLEAAVTSVIGPGGIPIPVDPTYEYMVLVFDNVDEFMNGLGVALRLQTTDNTTGLQLKYLLSYFHDNNIGLQGGTNEALPDFYNDNSTWRPTGDTKFSTTIPGINVPISCSTPALSGASDDFYAFDVHIGLKPGDDFGKPRPALPPRRRFERPNPIPKPKPGDIVSLPNGGKVEVGE
ncbi:hypothetical protein A1O7_08104 [Cladophialophora yegresii CBS 114405]|uniref:Uncharacterized protein n=1 Tax=Cladophialophora yegresii CBS 114405 TaxID=1182544 RepID=W9W9E4_9EURO|nr:uncharacterized protein A1O7_08104 [Cladophialophora yegresii CBS 114405]EXJ55179.1 hypothetical protein A1O7_08104 [Cladophialophora yegresii CBS 114405]